MSTPAIIDGTNIDLTVFSYSAPKANPAGGKVVNLYNKYAKESLTISVPLMSSWGAQESKEVVGKGPDGKPITKGTGKYTMSLQFAKGQYTTPDADAFLEQMKAVENKIKQDAMTYSKDWFGKEIKSMDVMDEKMGPMLKYPKKDGSEERDYDKSPSLTLKLPCWKDVWQTSVFDEDYNPLYVKGKSEPGVTPLDFLVSTSKAPIQVVCLIQCAGLWFIGNPAKVSITWNLKQVIVRKPKTSSIADDTCFLTVRPADMAALKAAPQPELDQNDAVSSSIVEDTDDEEEMTLPPPKPVEKPVEKPAEVASAPVEEKKKRVVSKKKE
jgi:hypothetical protein